MIYDPVIYNDHQKHYPDAGEGTLFYLDATASSNTGVAHGLGAGVTGTITTPASYSFSAGRHSPTGRRGRTRPRKAAQDLVLPQRG